ncbi:MAG TPA: AAA family ATPase [Hymenobacter sp.]|jgi:energy-coupling factor transporter ATP-binding protein EcfA2|uniref:AAA family ATPase n=1 Tax=Hymenobacter sp. TaxID=1898978 RepID=UPI002ED78828
MAQKKPSPPPAYFLSLSLENVRSFRENQKISFANSDGKPAQWTIILGDNGVGKTTVLKSLAMLMPSLDTTTEQADYFDSSFRKWSSRWWPIRNKGENSLSINYEAHVGTFSEENSINKFPDLGSRDFPAVHVPGHSERDKFRYLSATQAVPAHLERLAGFGYGAGRATGKSTLGEVSELKDNCFSLFDDRADLLNPEEWFLQADYRLKSNDAGITKQNFDLLRDALIKVLDDITDLKVSPVSSGGNPEQGLQLLSPYGWVRLRDMSLGYQTLAVWLTDFASKLFIRYDKSKNPLEEPAIVLIDEIDLHLHPSWQRKLIRFLSEIFKNTQFIATAHSPLVVQAAGDIQANVVLLKREGNHTVVVSDLPDIRLWRIDQILNSELFDEVPAHSLDTEKALDRRDYLLAKKNPTAKDREELDVLNRFTHGKPVGESSSERRAADVLRELARKIGKQDMLD